MNDTELLKHILGHLTVTESGDLDWPYSDLVEGICLQLTTVSKKQTKPTAGLMIVW